MEKRRLEERVLALLCFGTAGMALIYGMWLAASPLSSPAQAGTAGTIILAEVR